MKNQKMSIKRSFALNEVLDYLYDLVILSDDSDDE